MDERIKAVSKSKKVVKEVYVEETVDGFEYQNLMFDTVKDAERYIRVDDNKDLIRNIPKMEVESELFDYDYTWYHIKTAEEMVLIIDTYYEKRIDIVFHDKWGIEKFYESWFDTAGILFPGWFGFYKDESYDYPSLHIVYFERIKNEISFFLKNFQNK